MSQTNYFVPLPAYLGKMEFVNIQLINIQTLTDTGKEKEKSLNGLIMNGAIVASGNKSVENIQHRIYEVRGLQVMLDRDLAELYGVETRVLNQAVKRNIERFPSDFLFRLSKKEWDHLKSQIVISNNTLKNIDKNVSFCGTG